MLPHCSKSDKTLFPRRTQTYEIDFKIPIHVESGGYNDSVSDICFMKIKKTILKKDNCCDALYMKIECWLCNIKIIKEIGSEYGDKLHDRDNAFYVIRNKLKLHHSGKHKNIVEFYLYEKKLKHRTADYPYGSKRISAQCKLCDKWLPDFAPPFINHDEMIQHFQYCLGAVDEIARNAHNEDQEKDNIFSIIESNRKTEKVGFCDVSVYNCVYEYVCSWKKCDCGDAYEITCKICNNKFKSVYIGHFLYSRIISRHIKKKNINYNYRDLIINTTRKVERYEKDESGDMIQSANIKLGGYKCVICGMLYGSGVSEVPDEETVLAHFATCAAANSARFYNEGRICALKYVRFF